MDSTAIIASAEADEKFVELRIMYNPFAPQNYERHELVYNPEWTLADYFVDLPQKDRWMAAYDSKGVLEADWDKTKLEPGAIVGLALIPEGGNGNSTGKTVLRLVALIVITYLSWGVGTQGWLAGYGISGGYAAAAAAVIQVGGTMLVNSLMPPPSLTGGSSSKEDSPTYGVEGAKNTSTAGLPVPVAYGEFVQAGNIVDLYVENEGNDQVLYMRFTINDGEVDSIASVQVDGQPIENFKDWEIAVWKGDGTEPKDWFKNSIRMYEVNQKLDDDGTYVRYTTQDEVELLRADFVCANGQVWFSSTKDGGQVKNYHETAFVLEYKRHDQDDTHWAALPSYGATNPYSDGKVPAEWDEFEVSFLLETAYFQDTQIKTAFPEGNFQIRMSLSALEDGAAAGTAKLLFDETFPAYKASDLARTWGLRTVEFTRRFKRSDFALPTNKKLTFLAGVHHDYGATAGYSLKINAVRGVGIVTNYFMSGITTSAVRKSYLSQTLPKAKYDLRSKILGAYENKDVVREEITFSEVAEYLKTGVTLVGTSAYGIKIRASEQISHQPNVTVRCKGSKLKHYDSGGNFVEEKWSNNQAWIAVDILTNQTRGGRYPLGRIDWPMVKVLEQHIIDNGLSFNGVFDYDTNVWDALQTVLRTADASPVPLGTKWSFLIDRARKPTAFFNDANIIAGTYSQSWMSTNDRANEIRVTYYDKDERNKEKQVRVVLDNQAIGSKAIKHVEYKGFGYDTKALAQRDAEMALRRNRYIRKFVNFDAPCESIALGYGEVAQIQHRAAEFNTGVGGLLASGSTSTVLKLDRDVELESGQTYHVLGFSDAFKRFDISITAITGNVLSVTGFTDDEARRVRRLRKGSLDIEITNVIDSTHIEVRSATGITTGAAELWDTHVVEERTITTGAGTVNQVTVSSAFSFTPAFQSKWVVGKVGLLTELFTLMGISGEGPYQRTLSFQNYDERVYDPLATVIEPDPYRPPSVKQVTAVTLDLGDPLTGDPTHVTGIVSWLISDRSRYGGVDIYIDTGSGFKFVQSVLDATSWQYTGVIGQPTVIKVVAFNKQGARASFMYAPAFETTNDPLFTQLPAPTTLSVTYLGFDVAATVRASWLAAATDTDVNYRFGCRVIDESTYTAINADPALADPSDEGTLSEINAWNAAFQPVSFGTELKAEIANLPIGYYQFRVRAERGRSYSAWLTITYHVADPAWVPAITGLASATGGTTFKGRDCLIRWDGIHTLAAGMTFASKVPFLLKNYQVKVYSTDSSPVLLRTEYVETSTYAYTYEKNVVDTTAFSAGSGVPARRAVQIEVTAIGVQGQLSASQTVTFSNPAPELPLVTVHDGVSSFQLNFVDPIDPDFAGLIVWASNTSGFTPGPSNENWRGHGNPTIYGTPGSTVYYRFAGYDNFGDAGLTVSSEQSHVVPSISGDAISVGGRSATEVLNDIDYATENSLNAILESVASRESLEALLWIGGDEVGTVALDARTEADDAVSDISLIGARNSGGTGFIFRGDVVIPTSGGYSARSLSTLLSEHGANKAGVSFIMDAIDGKEAGVQLTTNVNGHINGLKFWNDGTPTGSGFVIVAGSFAIIDPGNGVTTPFSPFSISGGVVSMPNVYINKLYAASVVTDHLQDNSVSGSYVHFDTNGSNPYWIMPTDASYQEIWSHSYAFHGSGVTYIIARYFHEQTGGTDTAWTTQVLIDGVVSDYDDTHLVSALFGRVALKVWTIPGIGSGTKTVSVRVKCDRSGSGVSQECRVYWCNTAIDERKK